MPSLRVPSPPRHQCWRRPARGSRGTPDSANVPDAAFRRGMPGQRGGNNASDRRVRLVSPRCHRRPVPVGHGLLTQCGASPLLSTACRASAQAVAGCARLRRSSPTSCARDRRARKIGQPELPHRHVAGAKEIRAVPDPAGARSPRGAIDEADRLLHAAREVERRSAGIDQLDDEVLVDRQRHQQRQAGRSQPSPI